MRTIVHPEPADGRLHRRWSVEIDEGIPRFVRQIARHVLSPARDLFEFLEEGRHLARNLRDKHTLRRCEAIRGPVLGVWASRVEQYRTGARKNGWVEHVVG
jgi:hypothetical protein